MSDDLRTLEAIERAAWRDLYAAVPSQFSAAAGLSATEAGGATVLALRALPDPQFNRVLGLGVEAPASEAALDAALAVMREKGNPRYFLHIAPWAAPSILSEWLSRRGLRPYHRPWAKFRRDALPPPWIRSALTVKEVSPDRAMDFALPVAAGFGAPPPFHDWLAALPGRPGWRIVVAYDGELPVAGGALFMQGDVGWLGVAATQPSHRRRGAQQAVMATRIRLALQSGCRLFATETGTAVPGQPNSSWNNMERCDFRVAYLRDNYVSAARDAS